jgi:hypothetical protein
MEARNLVDTHPSNRGSFADRCVTAPPTRQCRYYIKISTKTLIDSLFVLVLFAKVIYWLSTI